MKIRKSLLFLIILLIAVVAFSLIFFKQKTDAQYSGGSGGGSAIASNSGVFGGKIINTKAKKIQELEGAGYSCVITGDTIEIKSTKGPTSYIIPSGTISKTLNAIRQNQWIIGRYKGQTTINCTKECPPTVCTSSATLNTISIFGNSK